MRLLRGGLTPATWRGAMDLDGGAQRIATSMSGSVEWGSMSAMARAGRLCAWARWSQRPPGATMPEGAFAAYWAGTA